MEKKYQNIIRVAVTGPECSGKTRMCRELAAHFKTIWVLEYSRQYLDLLKRKYVFEDLALIANGHLAQEKVITAQAELDQLPVIFSDTELINIKIWSEYRYNQCDPYIIEEIEKSNYHHYLLLKPDIPWVEDPFRENPHDRDYLFSIFEKELKNFNKPYTIISGDYTNRILDAVKTIESLF